MEQVVYLPYIFAGLSPTELTEQCTRLALECKHHNLTLANHQDPSAEMLQPKNTPFSVAQADEIDCDAVHASQLPQEHRHKEYGVGLPCLN